MAFLIRQALENEMKHIIEYAALNGWNPGIYDSYCFYNTDTKGFFLGLLDDKPIGCISAVSYGKAFGFLGFYIVLPQYQKMGYGMQLWKKGMSYLRDHNIGLDGVLEQQKNYEKSGFRYAYKNIRYQGNVIKRSGMCFDKISVSNVSFDKLNEYDKKFFPVERSKFLLHWIRQPQIHSSVIFDNEDNIQGYGIVRHCREGFKIAPLFANDYNIAKQILLQLLDALPESVVYYIDIPEPNLNRLKLIEEFGLNPVFETVRMYTQHIPKAPLDNIYGVTSFELG